MNHIDEGTVAALRDGSLIDGEDRLHVQGCLHCEGAVEEARQRAALIERTLATLDTPSDVEAAKAAVRARLDLHRDAPRSRRPSPGRHLGRAAAVLLVAAGAAYAIPGSPVRGWLSDEPDSGAPSAAVEGTQETRYEGGIEVEVPDGRIHVVVNGAAAGEDIEIVWSDGTFARISASAGSSFSFGEGRAEATVVAGPVRIELPRAATDIVVEVDGRTYLRRTSGGLEVLEPVVERSEDRVRFVVAER